MEYFRRQMKWLNISDYFDEKYLTFHIVKIFLSNSQTFYIIFYFIIKVIYNTYFNIHFRLIRISVLKFLVNSDMKNFSKRSLSNFDQVSKRKWNDIHIIYQNCTSMIHDSLLFLSDSQFWIRNDKGLLLESVRRRGGNGVSTAWYAQGDQFNLQL